MINNGENAENAVITSDKGERIEASPEPYAIKILDV